MFVYSQAEGSLDLNFGLIAGDNYYLNKLPVNPCATFPGPCFFNKDFDAQLNTANETGKACTPDKAPMSVFPMTPGTVMPEVEGCSKQDYQVLIVIGMMVETNS